MFCERLLNRENIGFILMKGSGVLKFHEMLSNNKTIVLDCNEYNTASLPIKALVTRQSLQSLFRNKGSAIFNSKEIYSNLRLSFLLRNDM